MPMKKISSWLMLASLWLCAPVAHAGTVTYVYTDPQGTPLAEADASGNITARFEYTPYGVSVPSMGAAPNGVGYTGHVNDPETGLVYMQARYYDPVVGRFLSVDPVTAYDKPMGAFNRYWYANNNPYRFIDPDGRQTLPPSAYQTDWTDPRTREAFAEGASAVADFTPVVGDVKGVVEAIREPTVRNIVAAGVGFIPIVGDVIGKGIKNADHLVEVAGELDRLKGGVRQGRVQGDANAILETITNGGKKGAGDRVTMPDGTIIGSHTSTKTGVTTIDINKSGQVYKIRVDPLPPPPPKPKD